MSGEPLHIRFDDSLEPTLALRFEADEPQPEAAFESGTDELLPVLRALRTALARHPIAVQAAFSALAEEGRSFARTSQGAAVRDALAHSSLFDRARLTWETLSLSAFPERSREIVPTVYLDAMLRAIEREAIEPLLSRVFDREE